MRNNRERVQTQDNHLHVTIHTCVSIKHKTLNDFCVCYVPSHNPERTKAQHKMYTFERKKKFNSRLLYRLLFKI